MKSNPDEITRDYFDSLLLKTRYLDSGLPSTSLTLFGEKFDTPIMTAALSHLHNTAENGMVTYAKAAAMSNADVLFNGLIKCFIFTAPIRIK